MRLTYVLGLSPLVFAGWLAHAAPTPAAAKITLDEALKLALQHNHNLRATRTTVPQSQAQEVTAGLRPNPVFSADWQNLPLFAPDEGLGSYLDNSSQVDLGLSYTFELGKRGRRLQAAHDATTVAWSQVSDAERTLTAQVATLFIGVQLAESTLDLTRENLKSFQQAVDIGEARYQAGGISENDYLKIKLQLLQFQTDVQQAALARAQALANLRQELGYESVGPDYDVAGAFDYEPAAVDLEGLQKLAVEHRPDLRAARQGVVAARSQLDLAKVNGRPDLTVSGTYSRHGVNTTTIGVSIPIPIFDHNQGEIARTSVAIEQAEELERAAEEQVSSDVIQAYEGLRTNARLVEYYRSGYLDLAQKNRDISEFAYGHGGTSLFDFLDAERSSRATQLAYRQVLAAYLLSLEQLRQAVGTRSLTR